MDWPKVIECRTPPSDSRATINTPVPDVDIRLGKQQTVVNLRDIASRNSACIFGFPDSNESICFPPGFWEKLDDIGQRFSFVGYIVPCPPLFLRDSTECCNAIDAGVSFIVDPFLRLCKALGMARDPTGRGLDIQLDKFVMILSHGQIQWIGLNEDLSADAVIVASSEIMSRGFNIDECLAKAKEVFNRSHSPYSANSAIGVAIATDRGIITGCTVENCAYPNSICGVRAAFVIALSEGVVRVDGCAIVGPSPEQIPYVCGLCREVMSEFGNFLVALAYSDISKYHLTYVGGILPGKRFCSEFIYKGRQLELSEEQITGYHPISSVAVTEKLEMLYQKCINACRNAYTPLSHFPVGAAVLTDKGIFTGSNVEHSIIGLALCAERTALCKAIAGGATQIKVLAVVCYKMETYSSPCGGCRQNLVEHEDFEVHLLCMDHKNKTFDVQITSALKLLPHAFTPAALR